MEIQYLGHYCFTIKGGSQTLLIDPAISQETFVKIPDFVLLTSSLYGHFNIPAFKFIPTTTTVIIPKGLRRFVKKFIPNPLFELSPQESVSVQGLTITAIPVHLWGYRLCPFILRPSTGYLIKTETANLFYPGNTGYGPNFKKLGQEVKLDTVILPYRDLPIKQLLHHRTLHPQNFVMACKDLAPKTVLALPEWFPTHNGENAHYLERLQEALLKVFPNDSPTQLKFVDLDSTQ